MAKMSAIQKHQIILFFSSTIFIDPTVCVTLRKLTFGKKPSTSYYNDRFPVLLTVILYKKYTKTIQKLYKYYTNTIQILYKYYTNTMYKNYTNTIQKLYKIKLPNP